MKKTVATVAALLITSAASAAPQLEKYGITINAGASVYPGKVLFVDCADKNPNAWASAFLINQSGAIIHQWQTGSLQWLAKPAGTDGTIVTFHQGGTGNTACGAPTGSVSLSKIDLTNKVTDIYHDPNCKLTHDFEVLTDGTYLILCDTLVTNPAISTQPFFDQIIRRISASGQVMWSWSTAAHYSQLGLTDAARQIIMAGQTYYPPVEPGTPKSADVFHTNNIQFIPHNRSAKFNPAFAEGNIMVDQRNTNLIFVIDYATGNIVWQVGNISVGQHTAKVIPTGLPGSGHILMLDNGGIGGYPPIEVLHSQVIEYDPITSKITWQWAQPYPGDYAFQTFYRGSTQRLPNGDTFIDEAAWGRFLEVNTAGDIVWEYVHDFGTTAQNKQAPDRTIYRAYKVAECWPGCAPEEAQTGGAWTW